MDIEQLMPHVEALIFASERPLTQIEMTEIIGQALETVIETDRISTCLEKKQKTVDRCKGNSVYNILKTTDNQERN